MCSQLLFRSIIPTSFHLFHAILCSSQHTLWKNAKWYWIFNMNSFSTSKWMDKRKEALKHTGDSCPYPPPPNVQFLSWIGSVWQVFIGDRSPWRHTYKKVADYSGLRCRMLWTLAKVPSKCSLFDDIFCRRTANYSNYSKVCHSEEISVCASEASIAVWSMIAALNSPNNSYKTSTWS